ncbi:MAG: cardiolipin synthase [Lewinellaceae bacterium]|nr:cardiolipin synthase [Saprospiraceae bacterium]MCB9336566.1 cardiolipin synthase [Lewinellaceae bacterium]
MLVAVLITLYVAILIGIIGFLLLYGARPTKTLAWLLLILVLPVLGMFLFFTFGLNRRKYKFYKLKKTRRFNDYLVKANRFYQQLDQQSNGIPEISEHLKLVKVIIKNSHSLPLDGNKVEVLQNGQATFDAIFSAMRQAKQFIHVQYYIFEEGKLLDQMIDIMTERAKAGVEVRIIYDGLGSFSLSDQCIQRLHHAKILLHCFMPLRFGYITTGLNYRNHRKIVIVDGEIGFTGGINISDKYIAAEDELGIWRDTHLRIEGPAVRGLSAVFANDWYFVSQSDKLQQPKYFPALPDKGKSTVQIVYSGPDSDFSSVLQQYFTIITQASKYVYIANSYIIPGEAVMEAMITAALSGVDVRLLLPEISDSGLVKWTVRSYFEQLLEAGVRIFLYQKSFLHCKVIMADDSVASVGTANLDIRSFEQNFEVNAVIYDPEVAVSLRQDFEKDCSASQELNFESYQQRPITEKLLEGSARIFSPVL